MSLAIEIPGPTIESDGSVSFRLWAPRADSVELRLLDGNQLLPMRRVEKGYFTIRSNRARAGSRYMFRKDGKDYPDPASRYQPEGVHGPSQVTDLRTVRWTDGGFVPPTLSTLLVYELHIGTFTREGTFAAAATRLSQLADLGITAVEIMPIAEFPGRRNWGYDGVSLYAAQSSYGGPAEFAGLVNAAHEVGLAVLLDVVFNHFGPEGNYSGQFGDYLTAKYHTPWGDAVNFDGPGSDEVRTYYFGCLQHWMQHCHVDGFRLDAIHEIHDESAVPFLSEVTQLVGAYSRKSGKRHLVIAESDLNDRRVTDPRSAGGLGMDAAWADDFHHAVHAYLTGERAGYYADFGPMELIARAIDDGWCYSRDYSVARDRHHGNDPSGVRSGAFVLCTQNHDQVGNRMLGERFRTLVGADAERAARALVLLMPFVPLLFMGQEYGEEAPFLYFVDHQDPELLSATREGRALEFSAFHASGSPPDPGSPLTFTSSVLQWPSSEVPSPGDGALASGRWSALDERALTRQLLQLRRQYDCFSPAEAQQQQVDRSAWCESGTLVVMLQGASSSALLVTNLSDHPAEVRPAAGAGARRPAALPESVEVVVALASSRAKGSQIRPADPLPLDPYEVVVALWPSGRQPSDR